MFWIRFDSLILAELCNGTLHSLVIVNKDSLELSSDRLRDAVLRQITEGMKYLHSKDILHRDLKPHNILYRIIISDEGKRQLVMKVADFGCSRSLPKDATHYTRTGVINGYSKRFLEFGTDGWLAPEVLNGVTHLRPPHAIDIYPLGLIFAFTLCRGRHPYGEDATAIDERIKKNEPILEDIRQQLIDEHGNKCHDLINRMLDPNPEGRPTAAEVLKDDYFPPRPIIRDPKVRYCVRESLHVYWVFTNFFINLNVLMSTIILSNRWNWSC